MVSWLPTAQVQQELLESHGPDLGHVLELRKPVFQRVLAWTQHLELQMKIPKARQCQQGSQRTWGGHGAPGTHLLSQKGAEEDEGDEVEVGEVTPTLRGVGELVTGPTAEAGQHDLMPGLPGGTPERRAEHEARREGPGLAGKEAQEFRRTAFPPIGILHRC